MDSLYRKDIDGLRAVAIVAVVAYHAGVPGFTGGFVGVDVFFVLSGFLITSLVAAEVRRTGRISMTGFYARRIRRLFPAMIVMVLVTCIVGAFVLLPVFEQQQNLGRSVIATALYVSNLYFWRHSPGYFHSSAEQMPLLHTWSLAVEEQFYLVWPPLIAGAMYVAHRLGWRRTSVLLILTAAILVLSFAWSLHRTMRDPTAAFYLLPARAWELATGAILALWLPRVTTKWPLAGTLSSAAGLIAVAISFVLIDAFTPFPGHAAALPVLGTGLVVLGGHLSERNPIQNLLSVRPMVLTGLLSYSWYLWHWPMLALARAHDLGAHNRVRDTVIVIASLGVAYLSFRFVENPIRYGRPGPFRNDSSTLLAGLFASFAICLPSGALIVAANRSAERPEFVALQAAKNDRPPLRATCHQDLPYHGLNPAEPCTSGTRGRPPRLFLWGDSHAEHLSPLMEAFAELPPGKPTLSRSFARCPPLARYPKHDAVDELACAAFNADVLAEITALREQGLRGVVLAGRWLRIFGAPRLGRVRIGGSDADLGPDHASLVQALEDTVNRLNSLGLRVLIIAPIPEMPFDVPVCLAHRTAERCGVSRDVAIAQRREVMRLLHGLAARNADVEIIDFIDELCDARTCFAERAGTIRFLDDNHLTASLSQRLLPVVRDSFLEAAGRS